MILGAGSPRPRCQHGWFGGSFSFWLVDGCLLAVCSHGLSCACSWREEWSLCLLFLGGRWSLYGGPTLMASFNVVTSQMTYFQIPSQWGLGFQHMNWGEGDTVDSISLKITQWWCVSMQLTGTQLKLEWEVLERGMKGFDKHSQKHGVSARDWMFVSSPDFTLAL